MFRKTVLARALTIAFAATVGSTVVVGGSAHAASNSAGDIVGRAAAGTLITIENKSIGLTRTLTVNKNGDYQLTMLPPGTYTVRAKRPDGSLEERQVAVNAGEAVSSNFEAATNTVVVTGRLNRIDVKSPESSMVLNEAAIDRIPVARDVTAVALLAPGATRGDARIGQTTLRAGNVPSLGGASPAENVYYINGFNVTNMLNGVAFNQVPFEAIASQQVKTGGYGPEYGRSLGGVLSITTKRGTNEWKGGANVIWEPVDLKGSSIYTEAGKSTNKWLVADRPGGTDDKKANLWAGGPVIQDKLFVFGLVQGADIEQKTYGVSTQTIVKSNTPRYLVKADWNINDNNTLELTAFNDESKDKVRTFASLAPYATPQGAERLPDEYTSGGQNYIAKYTSWLTDDFTVSAMAGLGKYSRASSIGSAACPFIRDDRTSARPRLGCATTSNITNPGANDERRAIRIDAEWNLGDHGLRFGLDNEEYKVVDGTQSSGGETILIKTLAPGSDLPGGYVNNTGAPIDFLQVRHFENGGAFTTKNSAFYLEDNWQVTQNLVANIGVRSESFENLNADDKTFIKVDNTIAPRFGLSWDVRGDQSLKLFANAGRYYIPVMSNTNVRLSGAELDYTDRFVYTGSNGGDAFQNPGRGAQLGTRTISSNGEAGDPRSVVDPNIKPMYQDEFILGAQHALANRWTVGAKVTYRKLKKVMDDMCNGPGAEEWALANGYNGDQAALIGGAIDHCFLYNPGGDLTANIDLEDGKGLTEVVIPAASLGFPQPQRKYTALELTFERAWDGVWNLQGSYVWSKSRGNTEGYVKSDIGQDDAGISQDWDYPGLMEGAYGDLPNDRRHTVKVFGAYQVTPELRLGANAIIQSGRPLNCLGYYSGNLDTVSILYGASSFYCNRQLNPRGTVGRLEWTRELSLQASYEPAWLPKTTFSIDVLNVFNERGITQVNEAGESARGTPSPNYLQPGAFQAGRSVRLMAQYEF
ncbi:carboxypeptidase regulatory-like domain-containing protein [Massilia sp. H6]|uniref:TonB-dependent receptor n=1 Tax=Massilia sp. H6 TaxID=2970464 RepID=UPI0021679E4B|nr:carboxypeptidase regulatory-like domain-containing protein [Massilia sp. H6]UVW29669.1 TonB-dependent receptor [Massilia sp. H6]